MGDWTRRYLDFIGGHKGGVPGDLLRAGLWIVSLGYSTAIRLRNLFYDRVKPASRRISRPVISVGNITVGGTGKTPLAAAVANLLLLRGRRVAIVLRGYKAGAIQFDDEQRESAASHWRMRSDEAMVLKRRCPKADVRIDANRVRGAEEAVEDGADVVVLDDGFQHRRLARDLDIVLVDATKPFGGGSVLPRGLLREPISALRRAGVIVLTRSDEVDATARAYLHRRLERASRGKPVIDAVHRLEGFMDLKSRPVEASDPADMQAVLFAGIGNFAAFRRSVEALGVKVLAAYEFPDHHDYTADELTGLADAAKTVEANVLLTTEKDAVKLAGRWTDDWCRLLVVGLEVEFVGDGDRMLSEALDAVLSRAPIKS